MPVKPFVSLALVASQAWSVLGQAGLCADFTQEVFPEANTFESNLGAIITADPQGAPVNNRCVNAIFIDLDTPTCGNTEEAVVDFPNQALCGWRTDRPAIWYGFVGTGKPMTIGVCTDTIGEIVDFGVFNVCNTQGCIANPNDFETMKRNELGETDFKYCSNGDYLTYTIDETDEGREYFVHVRAATIATAARGADIVHQIVVKNIAAGEAFPGPGGPDSCTADCCGEGCEPSEEDDDGPGTKSVDDDDSSSTLSLLFAVALTGFGNLLFFGI